MVLISIADTTISASNVVGLRRHAAHLADMARSGVQWTKFSQTQHNAVTEVAAADQLLSLKLHEQGDASLSTKDNFRRRQEIRRNFRVVTQLSKWWDAAIQMARLSRANATELVYADYLNVYKQVSMELLDEEDYDEEEAEAEVMEEWPKVAGADQTMGRQEFVDAMYEIADLCKSKRRCADNGLPVPFGHVSDVLSLISSSLV